MLKPIPQENPSSGKNTKKNNKQEHLTHVMHLQMKIRQFENNDRQLFAHAGKQLLNYLKKAENITFKELNELIHNLQRTVIGLQKKRIRIVQKQQRKKKRKP